MSRGEQRLATVPDAATIEALIDAAFWASLRREEGYEPRISLAFLSPQEAQHPLLFERPMPLAPAGLTRVAPAVERPGIHLGVWRDRGELCVWGATQAIPVLCFVLEVAAPGLLVVKHHSGEELRKFINVAVLEGDQIKLVQECASHRPDSSPLLKQLAVSMRAHGRGGLLLIVPAGTGLWQESIVQPVPYSVSPPFSELAFLNSKTPDPAVAAIGGLTAVDGAVVRKDRTPAGLVSSRAGHTHRADRRRHAGPGPSGTNRRHAAFVGGAVRSRSAGRGRAGGFPRRPLHGLRVVASRVPGSRTQNRNAAALIEAIFESLPVV
ncbi:hypothetical protein SBA3_1890001 [Candidatus Sulfopaludibacter sp. SbA3]|nr:hypothetical protein SBA3_1890001 [Candidatus Sulfopaludibacter sp. SbA3]